MPWAPKRPCATRGCRELVNGRWCVKHQEEADARERERKAAFDETRPSSSSRGYTSEAWRATRRRILKRDPWCVKCTSNRSTHVDHKVPRGQPGSAEDDSNLQGMCAGCHSSKTAREDSRFTQRRR